MTSIQDLVRQVWLRLPPITLSAALAALTVLAIDVLDSFGLDQETDERAARMIGVAEGPFYGLNDGRRGQKSVAVVLIDDTSLATLSWRAPLAYSDQADLVSLIAGHDPAAIFLDFSYARPHGENPAAEIADFRDRLSAETQDGRIPVFIGEVRAEKAADAPTLEPLASLRQVDVRWRAQSWVNYPFRGDNNRPTAAAALYEAFCARQRAIGHDGVCAPSWRPPADGVLAMTWGFGASQEAKAFITPDDDSCLMADASLMTRIAGVAQDTFEAFSRAAWYDPGRSHDPIQTRCVYSDTITAAQVFSENPDIATRVGALLKDRVVLVGASHSFTSDRHVIPHVGSIPGVLVHAMAVDNLITDQVNYSRAPPTLFLALDWSDLIEITLTLALILLMWNASMMAARAGADKRVRWRILITACAIGLVAIVTTLLVERLVLHWPSPNVFGVAALAASLFLLLEQHSQNEVVAPAEKLHSAAGGR